MVPCTSSRSRPLTNSSKIIMLLHSWKIIQQIDLNFAKGTFFDLLPMYVLGVIDNWIIFLKYHDKNKTILSWIKSQVSPVFCTLAFEYWKPYHNFGTLKLYVGTRYKWAHRLYKDSTCIIRTKSPLIKNTQEWMNLFLHLMITNILLYTLFFEQRSATYSH